MSQLNYDKTSEDISLEEYRQKYMQTKIYRRTSLYTNAELHDLFYELKANVVDLNKANVIKYVQGGEEDFLYLMRKAKEFLTLKGIREQDPRQEILLHLFNDCVFGYYILTPLLEAEDVSDIKILSWDNIVCKAYGDRYTTNLRFESKTDYEDWIERYMRIHRQVNREDNSLMHFSDTNTVADYQLRVDVQLPYATSSNDFNLHIRKIPKIKYTWEYLIEKKMLDEDILQYLMDRIPSGYSFLLSGVGGSGKTSLLNNMLDLIPYSNSILISQESDELYSNEHPQIQIEHTIEIEKRGKKIVYSLADELRLGLLQDIDSIIVGEMKGEEALDVMTTALNTGATFMGTTHSNTARSSADRLVDLAMSAPSNYTMPQLQKMISRIPIVLIHLSHFSVDEICEVVGWNEEYSQLQFKTIYRKEVI